MASPATEGRHELPKPPKNSAASAPSSSNPSGRAAGKKPERLPFPTFSRLLSPPSREAGTLGSRLLGILRLSKEPEVRRRNGGEEAEGEEGEPQLSGADFFFSFPSLSLSPPSPPPSPSREKHDAGVYPFPSPTPFSPLDRLAPGRTVLATAESRESQLDERDPQV